MDIEFVPGKLGLPPAKVMCKECPLSRGSINGYLGGYTTDQYIQILHSDVDIACHMSKGFPRNHAEQRSCTGVAHYRANVIKMPREPSHAAEAVRAMGKNTEEVFATPMEFAEHHKLGAK